MQVAAFLSDLRSLSVCSHESATGLVQTYRGLESNSTEAVASQRDKDLQRADELVSLHQNVKLKHIQDGQDQELLRGRQAVQAVLASLTRHR